MSKVTTVTIRGVDKELYEQTLIEVIKNRRRKKGTQTMGEIYNEMMKLRQEKS